jgi:hypothetical protein
MGKVKRSATARAIPVSAATAPRVKKSAPAATEATTADTTPAAKVVIEIPSSPDYSEGPGNLSSRKRARKWSAPPLYLDDEIEMWTPREKRRLDEDCKILAGDPLAAAEVVPAATAAAGNSDIVVVAERGKVHSPRAFFIYIACGGTAAEASRRIFNFAIILCDIAGGV